MIDPVEILKNLVSIPSVNPMLREVSGPEFLETRLSDFLADFFVHHQIPFDRVEILPGRANILARIECPGAQTTILLDAHQDTVPTDGMTIPPFTPEIRDGKLFGRGSCDVKGGMASMLAAFVRIAKECPKLSAHLVLSCTCDEESTAQGAQALARSWADSIRRHPYFPTPPAIAVVAEPTDLNIVVAHRGAVRWKLKTSGKACHSSRPQEGVNAIYKMAEVLHVLEKFAAEVAHMAPAHPLCGVPTLSVGRISGGISVNTVPDECFIEIDRRVIPGEDPSQVIPQVTNYLRNRVDVDFEMLTPWCDGVTLSDRNNGAWADRLLRQIEPIAGPRQKVGAWYGTNASRFAVTGVPGIVFGPGSIEQAHTVDEWIEIEQVRQASEIYFRFCTAEEPFPPLP